MLRPEIFTRDRDWQRLSSAHSTGNGVPLKINGKIIKIWPKIQHVRPYNFGLVEVYSRKFSRRRAARHVWQCGYDFWKTRPLNFGRAETSKFRRDLWQLSRLIANIYGTVRLRHIENRKKLDQLQPAPRLAKKMVNFDRRKKFQWCILTHRNEVNSGDYISALKGRCPFKFLNVLEIDPGYIAHPPSGTGSRKKILMAKT